MGHLYHDYVSHNHRSMENNHFFPLGNDQIFFGRGAPRALEPPSGTIPTQEMSKLSVLRIVV